LARGSRTIYFFKERAVRSKRTFFSRSIFKAFSLIELLVVVAIIAILCSIGVINLLQAQTRSKVSRAKADMRTIATAVESYNVDHNAYPFPANQYGAADSSFTASGFETHTPSLLTTPVAYVSMTIEEPFPAGDRSLESPLYHYSTRSYFLDYDMANSSSGPAGDLNSYLLTMMPSLASNVEFFIFSHGPDSDHDTPVSGVPALYDPTNGVVSNGDIGYWGPGAGLKN